MPFFEILKSAEVFQWGSAQQKAFEELNQFLIVLTTLTPPSLGAPLLLYVAASHSAVSAALVQEKQDGQVKKTSTSIFCLRSSKLIQEKLYRIGEGAICYVDSLQEASALLSIISYNCSFITTSEGHNEK
jgi:hypothetical protein